MFFTPAAVWLPVILYKAKYKPCFSMSPKTPRFKLILYYHMAKTALSLCLNGIQLKCLQG